MYGVGTGVVNSGRLAGSSKRIELATFAPVVTAEKKSAFERFGVVTPATGYEKGFDVTAALVLLRVLPGVVFPSA